MLEATLSRFLQIPSGIYKEAGNRFLTTKYVINAWSLIPQKYLNTTFYYLKVLQRMGGGGEVGHKRVWPLAETRARRREPGLGFLW